MNHRIPIRIPTRTELPSLQTHIVRRDWIHWLWVAQYVHL